jgi:hypothetical protein
MHNPNEGVMMFVQRIDVARSPAAGYCSAAKMSSRIEDSQIRPGFILLGLGLRMAN